MGIYQFIMFSTNRWKIAATCALVALPFGMSLPEAPLTSPSTTAQPSAALAQPDTLSASEKPFSFAFAEESSFLYCA